APIGIQSKGAVPMEKSGSKSLHLQGGAQEDHHLAISGCRNGHGPDLNGEPYALKGARTVRGGEAPMRFLLHFQPGRAFSTWRSCWMRAAVGSLGGRWPRPLLLGWCLTP